MVDQSSTTLATIDEHEKALANITSTKDARRMVSILKGLAVAADREYKAAQTLSEGKEVRDDTYYAGLKIGELRLKAEARLGELLKEQIQHKGGRPAKNGNINVTVLKDIGLTKIESSRAQQIANHQDLIPVVIAKAEEAKDLPTRKEFERVLREEEGKAERNSRQRVKLPQFLEDINPIFYEFSVWEVPERRPEGGMAHFRGNCSPYVCAGCLYNYSKVGDIVLDPMVGSGTFLDVASAVTQEKGEPAYSQIIVSDLNPVRPDIPRCDAAKLDLPDDFVDFLFTHFAYWNSVNFVKQSRQMTGQSVNEADALSNMAWASFIEKSKVILAELFRVLKENAYFCLMVGSKREDEYLWDLTQYFKAWGKDVGFALYDEILVMTYNPRKINFDSATGQRRLRIGKGRQDDALNICHDYVLVFRKENA